MGKEKGIWVEGGHTVIARAISDEDEPISCNPQRRLHLLVEQQATRK